MLIEVDCRGRVTLVEGGTTTCARCHGPLIVLGEDLPEGFKMENGRLYHERCARNG